MTCSREAQFVQLLFQSVQFGSCRHIRVHVWRLQSRHLRLHASELRTLFSRCTIGQLCVFHRRIDKQAIAQQHDPAEEPDGDHPTFARLQSIVTRSQLL